MSIHAHTHQRTTKASPLAAADTPTYILISITNEPVSDRALTGSVRKGVSFTVEAAARQLVAWEQQGADWFLFHTRRATTSRIATEHCHPFRVGAFVLAHNGHDALWARLGQAAQPRPMTDSEAIARAWAALRLDPAALCELNGAFVGFQAGYPFVAKDTWSDLLWAQGAQGAILFASQLPEWLELEFDEVQHLGEYCWLGGTHALPHFAAGKPFLM